MKKSALDQLVINTLYHDEVSGIGPQYNDKLKAKKVRFPAGTGTNVIEIIPDNAYHPEAQVCIDFSHTFVNTITEEQAKQNGLTKGEPIIDYTILRNIALDIMYKYYIYFDNAFIENIINTEKKQEEAIITQLGQKEQAILDDDVKLVAFLNKFINIFITNISVTRSINSIGMATVTLKESYYENNGTKVGTLINPILSPLFQLLVPALPISIYARGRIYSEYYFPIFNGFIQQVNPKDNQGYVDIDLVCKDVLELARTSTEMLNPALVQVAELSKQNFVNINTMPLYGKDHTLIFKTMFSGGEIGYSSTGATYMGPPSSAGTSQRISPASPNADEQKLKFSSLGYPFVDNGAKNVQQLMEIQNIGKYIKIPKKETLSYEKHVKYTSYKYRKRALFYWGQTTTPYRTFALQSPRLYTSDFESRLSVLEKTASLIYYNFYVDGFGDVHFHPQRLANTFLKNIVYDTFFKDPGLKNPFPSAQIVGLEETIANTSLLNKDEWITFFVLIGENPFIDNEVYAQTMLKASGVDKKSFAKYGYIRGEEKNEMFNYNVTYTDSSGNKYKYFDLAASELLKYKNACLYTRTANIVFRPEIDIALPVYFSDTDEVFYLREISHNIPVGGEATTTVNGYLGRKYSDNPPDLYSYMVINDLLMSLQTVEVSEKQVQYIDDLVTQFKKQEDNFRLPLSEQLTKESALEETNLIMQQTKTEKAKTKNEKGKATKKRNDDADTEAAFKRNTKEVAAEAKQRKKAGG